MSSLDALSGSESTEEPVDGELGASAETEAGSSDDEEEWTMWGSESESDIFGSRPAL